MIFQSCLKESFRASPFFQLLEWNRLEPLWQHSISNLPNEEEIYGLFQPVPDLPLLNPHIATKDTSLLYLHLQQHRHLPHYLTRFNPEKAGRLVAELVLDSILEIWWKGEFVHGSRAVEALYGKLLPLPENHVTHRLSISSLQAIRYAFELKNLNLAELAMHLYTFGTTPWDAYTKERFLPGDNTIHQFLLSNATTHLHQLLSAEWWFYPSPDRIGWLSWERRGLMNQTGEAKEESFKLYISPTVADLPAVFQKAVPLLTEGGAQQFKVGNSVEGILRPDKMVAYFESASQLRETANRMEAELVAYRAQGVPFTSSLDQKGLLSWGIDPSEDKTLLHKQTVSWRTTVTRELASAILQAQVEGLSFEASFPFLHARLAASGIDMLHWLPSQYSHPEDALVFSSLPEHKT